MVGTMSNLLIYNESYWIGNLENRQSCILTPLMLSTVPEYLFSLSTEGQVNPVLAAELQSFQTEQERIILGKMWGSRDT